jgi:hypothetical protein
MGLRIAHTRTVILRGMAAYCVSVYYKINIFCIANLRPEIKTIATNCMPDVVSAFLTALSFWAS